MSNVGKHAIVNTNVDTETKNTRSSLSSTYLFLTPSTGIHLLTSGRYKFTSINILHQRIIEILCNVFVSFVKWRKRKNTKHRKRFVKTNDE